MHVMRMLESCLREPKALDRLLQGQLAGYMKDLNRVFGVCITKRVFVYSTQGGGEGFLVKNDFLVLRGEGFSAVK